MILWGEMMITEVGIRKCIDSISKKPVYSVYYFDGESFENIPFKTKKEAKLKVNAIIRQINGR